MNRALLAQVRDGLPPELNAGILMGDGGFCVLGWMLLSTGMHPIKIYNSTHFVADQVEGGHAIDVVARLYDLDPADVRRVAEVNDATPADQRTGAVRELLDELLARGEVEAAP